jgi:formyl-CoA transferase
MSLPLSGIKVLDLTRALAGPFCTMILADLGAEVIKVEPPGGEMIRGWGPFKEGISVYYLSIHRNKKSLVLNLRNPKSLDLLREMVPQVDVVVENFKPGVMADMGLDWNTLEALNPRLVMCSISGMGRGGPYEDWPGMDQIAQGMSGLMSLTGHHETGPVRVGIPIGDVTAGMWAALGVQAALIQRQVTGKGQWVETSLLGGLVGMLNVQGQRQLSLNDTPGVAGNDHPVICPYGVFQAQDGPFNMAAATDEMFARLCRLVELPDLPNDPRFSSNTLRMKNSKALKTILNERFATRGKMDWTLDLVKLGLPAGPIFDLSQAFSDPHISQSGMIEEVEHPTIGTMKVLANPIRMPSLGGKSVRTPPPLLGEHNREVLKQFGFADDRVESLIHAGIVAETKGES